MFSREALEILLKTMSRLTHPIFDWIFEDYLSWLILAKEGFSFYSYAEATFYYRFHSQNISALLHRNFDRIKTIGNFGRSFITLLAFYALYKDLFDLRQKLKLFKRVLKLSSRMFNMIFIT